jgi:cytochrome c oxidase assembly protein subunit 15
VLFGIGILFVQILLGTQVREAIDRVAQELNDREGWVSALGLDFIIHRSFSWVVLVVHGLLVFKLLKMRLLIRFSLVLILLILGTLFTGIGMAWYGVPPYLQPIHLLLATVTFGVEFMLLLQVSIKRST